MDSNIPCRGTGSGGVLGFAGAGVEPEGLGLRLAEDDLDAPVAPSSVMIER